jgi:hypothetical protein
VSHPADKNHEWPYRCTSCSIMHNSDEGEDRVYYQNLGGQECCKECPENTLVVGSVGKSIPDTIRKCVCKWGFFTQYVDFAHKMRIYDPTRDKMTSHFSYPRPLSGYRCEPCHLELYMMTFIPEKKGYYCGEPTINGKVMSINKEYEGCTSEFNPVCVLNF